MHNSRALWLELEVRREALGNERWALQSSQLGIQANVVVDAEQTRWIMPYGIDRLRTIACSTWKWNTTGNVLEVVKRAPCSDSSGFRGPSVRRLAGGAGFAVWDRSRGLDLDEVTVAYMRRSSLSVLV